MPEQRFKITTAPELRAILGEAITGILEGRINVSQGNAIVGLSGELHKSLRQEWDMRCYMAENLTLEQARIVVPVLENANVDAEVVPKTT